jgi:hypothetical protein
MSPGLRPPTTVASSVASSHHRPTRLRRFSDRYAGIDAARFAAAAVAEDDRALTASTQGNETLTPAWSLTQFPCATDI